MITYLVTGVSAVIWSVTLPTLGDALGVVAGELLVLVADLEVVLAVLALVAAVPTVVLPVALPGHWDASPVIAAELGILAGHINAPRLIWGEYQWEQFFRIFPGMPAAIIIGMWRWNWVGCNLGRELDRTYMTIWCHTALHQRLKHSDVSAESLSWCHLLPIDETSNGLRLIAQHPHIAAAMRPDPDQTTLSHVVILTALCAQCLKGIWKIFP